MTRIFLILLSIFLIGSALLGLLADGEVWKAGPADNVMASLLNEISGDSITMSIRALSEERSRRLFSNGARRTVSFISSKLVQYGLDVRLENHEIKNLRVNNITLTNIIAQPGGRNDSDSLLILCTHYDSRGEGWNESAPGADDNASGAAVLLEVARVIGQLPPGRHAKGFILAFFAGGEDSYVGSSAFVRKFLLERNRRELICAINVDMVGYDRFGPKDFVVFSNKNSVEFSRIIEDCSSLYTQLRCETTITSVADSDHYPFWRAGFKAISVWEGYDHNPYYHSTLDTVDRLSPAFMEEIARMLVCAVSKCTKASWEKAHSFKKKARKGSLVEKRFGSISQDELPVNPKLIPSSK